jgi:two-component system CheB/CheR fusion protein
VAPSFEHPPASAARPGAPRPSHLLRILVVDDNEDGREMLGYLLNMDGHTVELAVDGPSGLAAALSFRPEVAILDIGMPGMDGYTVAETLRRGPLASSVVLVALSGMGQGEDKIRATEAGFDCHFTKPVDIQSLRAFLASVKPR